MIQLDSQADSWPDGFTGLVMSALVYYATA